MNKEDIINFFDTLAPNWDADMIRHDDRINEILNYADIRQGISVLDVACGTGVLFPDYLSRGVSKIVGVDISPQMINIAKSKFPDIELHCADIEQIHLDEKFDCCMVYNAFPHFPNPSNLINCLSTMLKTKGRLTIAHGMSRAEIDSHHTGAAQHVSNGLMHEHALANLFSPYFDTDTEISNSTIYVVSGIKK